ncbi:MAG: TonB C-terminal domain-containing protein [Candidatus Aminicenantales bacterium]
MKITLGAENRAFKRAMIFSLTVHTALFLLILISPSLPKTSKKGMIHYIPLQFVGLPGSGGGGRSGAKEELGVTELKKETLRDLTSIQKLQEEPKSSLRHPVESPKRETKIEKNKKAAIRKPSESSSRNAGSADSPGSGSGSGLRIGVGGPGSGEGFISGYGGQIGISNFPFTYYLQIVRDRISSNWFTSLADPGLAGNLQTTVYFRIFRSGQISDVKVMESSGVKSFDLVAVGAAMRSAPFPPLPSDYEEEYLGIYLIFEHSK